MNQSSSQVRTMKLNRLVVTVPHVDGQDKVLDQLLAGRHKRLFRRDERKGDDPNFRFHADIEQDTRRWPIFIDCFSKDRAVGSPLMKISFDPSEVPLGGMQSFRYFLGNLFNRDPDHLLKDSVITEVQGGFQVENTTLAQLIFRGTQDQRVERHSLTCANGLWTDLAVDEELIISIFQPKEGEEQVKWSQDFHGGTGLLNDSWPSALYIYPNISVRPAPVRAMCHGRYINIGNAKVEAYDHYRLLQHAETELEMGFLLDCAAEGCHTALDRLESESQRQRCLNLLNYGLLDWMRRDCIERQVLDAILDCGLFSRSMLASH